MRQTNKEQKRGKIFIITGPSGVGKTTVARTVLTRNPWLKRLPTHTTRAPRPKERHGRDYFFVSEKTFERKKAVGEFFEYARVYGEWYGSSRRDLERMRAAGISVMLVIDIQGAKTIKRRLPEAVVFFIAPNNLAELEKRLSRRHNVQPKDLHRRLQTAKKEMAMKTIVDYVVVNREGRVKETVRRISVLLAQCR